MIGEINPLQAMLNGLSADLQKSRALSQMTLGQLIDALKAMPAGRTIRGMGREMSYRGYYSDLAFDPSGGIVTAGELLAQCQNAMGQIYTGYKGGDYGMTANTPVWIANYGCCGDRLMGLSDGDPATPITSPDE